MLLFVDFGTIRAFFAPNARDAVHSGQFNVEQDVELVVLPNVLFLVIDSISVGYRHLRDFQNVKVVNRELRVVVNFGGETHMVILQDKLALLRRFACLVVDIRVQPGLLQFVS